MLLLCALPLVDTAEYRLNVDDWRSIDRLEAADVEAVPGNLENPYSMETNRIGPARCPGTEHTRLGSTRVSTRMHPQDVAIGLNQVNTMISSPTAIPSSPA